MILYFLLIRTLLAVCSLYLFKCLIHTFLYTMFVSVSCTVFVTLFFASPIKLDFVI